MKKKAVKRSTVTKKVSHASRPSRSEQEFVITQRFFLFVMLFFVASFLALYLVK